jgi:glycosyltransferase involved in cell wall biosynthesis
MRIAMDASAFAITSGGLRRYTEELARALVALGDCVEWQRPSGRLWWSLRLPLRLRNHDVFHGTNFEVPYLPVCPAVMTVHDASPWMKPEWHSGARRVRRRTPWLIGLGLASMLIVPTEAVRRQVLELFAIHADRVVAIHEGASMRRVETMPPARPYFLFVGTIEPRKNLPALIASWRPLREHADLVVVGRARADAPRIQPELGLHLAGEVSEAHLLELYSGALALVYPSMYEGFGLPVIEAMQCGTPVIASRDPALLEVAGGAAVHADAGHLTGAMRAMLEDTELRGRFAAAALARGREFTWERTARLTREVYVEAIARARTVA